LARNISPFKLGLFVLICGSLALGAIIWLGASHYFEERKTYVTYFAESVKGLQTDAVVNYRGVGVGRTAAIQLAPDGRLIEVVMYLNPDFKVDESIAIQLREQGLTGLRYLEIDSAPADLERLTPEIDFPLRYPLIPSHPSEIQQLKTALETIYTKIMAMDLQSLTDNWTQAAQRINSILAQFEGGIEPEDWRATVRAVKDTAEESSRFMSRLTGAASEEGMKKGFKDLSATLVNSRQASEALARQLKGLPPDSLAKMTRNWEETLTSGGNLFSSTDQAINESAILLQQSLQQFQALLTQLSAIAQTLKEQPNRLIFPPNGSNPFERKRP
jgi:phospholipid/cholesterol/gamma-HCH transport system substrate-binding protein